MKYCQNCGKQIEDGAKLCIHCGSSQGSGSQTAPQSFVPGGKQLHCPKCKSVQLSPIVETDVQGGFAFNRSVGRKWGASAVDLKSTHRNYWMCGQCGHKFRNIDSLEEEIAVQAKAQRSCVYSSIQFAVLILLSIILGGGSGVIVLLIPLLLMFGCLWLWFRSKVAKLNQEKEYLETNCFN